MFPLMLTFGVAALGVSLWRALSKPGFTFPFFLHVVTLLAVSLVFKYRRRWPVPRVFGFMLLIGYFIALQSLLDLGLGGTGMLHLSALCAFAGIFLGLRAGVMAVAAGGMIICLAGACVCTGIVVTRPGVAAYMISPFGWIMDLLCYLMYLVPLVLATHGLHTRMAASMGLQKEDNTRLEKEIKMRNQAEEALRESEGRLREVIDLVPHFIFAKDRDGRFILANKAVADAFGTTVEGLLGKRDRDFNPKGEEVEHFREDDLGVIEGGVPKEIPEERITDITGRTRILRTVKIPFSVSATGERAVLGVSTDITAFLRAEEKAAEGERRYRELAESLPQAIAELDEMGNFTFENEHGCRLFGYTKEEFDSRTRNLSQVLTPEDYKRASENVRRLAAGETRMGTPEYMAVRKDGSVFPVTIYASPIMRGGVLSGFRAIIIDISERKSIEQALKESEAKYRGVVESSLVGFYIIQDDFFRFVNQRFCDMTGYSYNELVDTLGPADLTHPDDKALVSENIAARMAGEMNHIEYDFRSIRKDGHVCILKTLGSAITYEGRVAAMGTVIEITREKHLESHLRQAQKMEAIGTLTGGIAHDFNNILTALVGYGSLLQMRMDGSDPLRVYVDQILSAAQKAAGLTKVLLTFGRKQPINLQPIRLNDIVEGTKQLLNRLLTEDITLHTRLDSENVSFMADATQIDQILFNLVTNARDSMPKGGVIAIETQTVLLDELFMSIHGFGQPGQYVLLVVSDTGVGMDEATREKIFEPFFTTKATGKGTGLGLATVYGIVKQHGGYITVYSEQGTGTSFRIYFPVAKGAPRTEQSQSLALDKGKETILIAEDNDEVRRFTRDILKLCGYRVVEAVDGEDGVAKFREAEKIDLLLLDTVMPRKNGKEALEEIKKIRPDVRFLFMSGHTMDILLDKGLKEKEFDFISKPLSPNELLRKVREILDR
jgi:PAS domain S-box-containing protein